ncbi:ankyrin repeat domain-containing protein [Gordonia sp. CPCC 205333]|uniref:ankyrin repeat domain-containing protein n=1 Tax=Gordonia sp. CPCC 205333 TaxID=3140790 RepID=UPI003AF3E218
MICVVGRGHTELVRSMLATGGFNVNQGISAGNTLLHLAVQQGRFEIVEQLVAYEAETNSRGDDGRAVAHQPRTPPLRRDHHRDS